MCDSHESFTQQWHERKENKVPILELRSKPQCMRRGSKRGLFPALTGCGDRWRCSGAKFSAASWWAYSHTEPSSLPSAPASPSAADKNDKSPHENISWTLEEFCAILSSHRVEMHKPSFQQESMLALVWIHSGEYFWYSWLAQRIEVIVFDCRHLWNCRN